MRALAASLTVAAIYFTGSYAPLNERWDSIVYSMAFGHYFIAFLFSQKQLKQVTDQPHFVWKTMGLLSLGGLFYFRQWLPLLFYFGVHHAFNEVYQLDRVTKDRENASVRALRPAGAAVNLSVFLFLVRNQLYIDRRHPEAGFPFLPLAAALALSYAVYFYWLWRASRTLSLTELIDNGAAEIVSLFMVYLSFHWVIRSNDIVAYHFIYWALRPVPGLAQTRPTELLKYSALTAFLFGFFFLVSPLGAASYPLQGSLFHKQFILWSYVHITTSFALSDFHPRGIVRFFRPS